MKVLLLIGSFFLSHLLYATPTVEGLFRGGANADFKPGWFSLDVEVIKKTPKPIPVDMEGLPVDQLAKVEYEKSEPRFYKIIMNSIPEKKN